jgi:striatin 1/3/4
MQDTRHFVVTYDTLKTFIYDTETGKVLRQIVNDTPSDASYRINRVISHPSQPMIITAHDDRNIRFFDTQSGKEEKEVIDSRDEGRLSRSNDS